MKLVAVTGWRNISINGVWHQWQRMALAGGISVMAWRLAYSGHQWQHGGGISEEKSAKRSVCGNHGNQHIKRLSGYRSMA